MKNKRSSQSQASSAENNLTPLSSRTSINLSKELVLVPLSGKGITNLNLWGVVSPDINMFEKFQAALGTGKICMLVGLDKVFEIRINSKSRAIGALQKGETCVTDILELNATTEIATEKLEQMKVFGADNLAIIYFNCIAAKHGHIYRVAEKIR